MHQRLYLNIPVSNCYVNQFRNATYWINIFFVTNNYVPQVLILLKVSDNYEIINPLVPTYNTILSQFHLEIFKLRD
jgi:hypothetical protein